MRIVNTLNFSLYLYTNEEFYSRELIQFGFKPKNGEE